MAGVFAKFRTNPISTTTAARTIAQLLAAANHGALVRKLWVSFNGIANTDAPIRIDVLRQTTPGTMTASGTNSTIVKDPNDQSETIQTTLTDTATVEPTAGDILITDYCHPQTGWEWNALRPEDRIKIGGAGRVGIRVTAGVSVNCVVGGLLEE